MIILADAVIQKKRNDKYLSRFIEDISRRLIQIHIYGTYYSCHTLIGGQHIDNRSALFITAVIIVKLIFYLKAAVRRPAVQILRRGRRPVLISRIKARFFSDDSDFDVFCLRITGTAASAGRNRIAANEKRKTVFSYLPALFSPSFYS